MTSQQFLINLIGQAGLLIIPLAALYGILRYGKRIADVTWLIAFVTSVLSLIAMLLLQLQGLVDPEASSMFQDPTGISYAIAILFSVALMLNAKTFWKVMRELRGERHGQEGATRRNLRNSLLRHAKNDQPDEAAIAEVDIELDAREDLPRLIKKMLPTLGLLGTVIGLAMAMQQLGQALADAMGGSGEGSDALLQSMQGALSGMGGAFTTTLFGAGFGMLLMVLLTRTRLMLTQLITEAKTQLDKQRNKSTEQPAPRRHQKGTFRPGMN